MLEKSSEGLISLERVVEKMAHAPSELFNVSQRGFIKEGYYADIVVVDPNKPYEVNKSNILSKCGWSPFENHKFKHSIEKTFVNGNLVYDNGNINEGFTGKRLLFNRG